MKILITGASSGIGRDMARVCSDLGHDLILVARSKDKLEELKKELSTNVEVIALDLASTFNCTKLYNKVKKENIDVLINNAGFGLFGEFNDVKLDKELDMIDLNIKALHTLTKLFLNDFIKRDSGYILNVASSAGLMPGGPLMATYYATKSYVVSFSSAIAEELRKKGSHVSISILCPGPVDTNFNNVANVQFALKGMNSMDVAKYAIKKCFKKKLIIVPGIKMKLATTFARIIPRKELLKITYHMQERKR